MEGCRNPVAPCWQASESTCDSLVKNTQKGLKNRFCNGQKIRVIQDPLFTKS